MSDAAWYRWDSGDLVLRLKIQPKASRDEFAGLQTDRMRLRITAPPTDGCANRHLSRWLAKQFGVSLSAVLIETGHGNPLKRIRIKAPSRLPATILARDD